MLRSAPGAPRLISLLAAGALVAGCASVGVTSAPVTRTVRTPPPATTAPVLPPTGSATPPSRPGGPGPVYYLSLGDSLAFGYQEHRVDAAVRAGRYDPTGFPGYTRGVAAKLAAAVHGRVVPVNYGCPGETTATFVGGRCVFRGRGLALHQAYDGSQLAAAVRFLRAHRGRTRLVTLSLGANDLLLLQFGCGADVGCLRDHVPAAGQRVASAVGDVVRTLLDADPATTVVVLALYNPVAHVEPGSDPLLVGVDRLLAAAVRRAGGRVADAHRPFNEATPQPQTLCRLTLFCGAGHDVHPSDAGYAVLADVLWRAAGISG